MKALSKVILFLFAVSATGQEPLPLQKDYVVSKTTSLSGSAEVITIQQPAEGARNVRGRFCKVYVPGAACGITVERNGTAATSTALAVVPMRPNLPAAAFVAFSGSNVGSGSVIGRYEATPQVPAHIDISLFELRSQGAAQTDNLTLRSASCTTTITLTCVLYEY